MPAGQRDWLLLFIDRLAELLDKQFTFRVEMFWQTKAIQSLLGDATKRNAIQFPPMTGLFRAPDGQQRQAQPDQAESSKEYGFWFVDKGERKMRDLFFGYGGMTMLFMKPDPAAMAPKLPLSPKYREHPMFKPLFQQFDIDRLHSQAYALLDGFQERSKQLFGVGLENDAEYRGLRFVLPLLRATDFFEQSYDKVEKWFSLFDVYIGESPDDHGILLASKIDLKDKLFALLDKMTQDGLEYPDN